MGNRANVIFVAGYDKPDTHFALTQPTWSWKPRRVSPTIYLHWNGGPESVYAFLAELDSRDIRADADYEAARFIQVVGEFFDSDYRDGMSLGVVNTPPLTRITGVNLGAIPTDSSDNGFYVVDRTAAGIEHRVRRFTSERYVLDPYDPDADNGDTDQVHYLLCEWSKEQVDAEYSDVLKSATYLGIRELFDGIRGFTSYNEYMDSLQAG